MNIITVCLCVCLLRLSVFVSASDLCPGNCQAHDWANRCEGYVELLNLIFCSCVSDLSVLNALLVQRQKCQHCSMRLNKFRGKLHLDFLYVQSCFQDHILSLRRLCVLQLFSEGIDLEEGWEYELQ